MAGSVAEERIRAKVEASLRAELPDARIVHELNMEWGGIRLDLAAVSPSRITLVEIKSERDTLKRLGSQVEAALNITGDVRVYAAEKHRKGLTHLLESYELDADGKIRMVSEELRPGHRRTRTIPNPDYLPVLNKALILIEAGEAFEPLEPLHASWWPRRRLEHMADPRAMLELLWADELRAITGTPRQTRPYMKRVALETLNGYQIRAAVCSALRGRTFARADAKVAA